MTPQECFYDYAIERFMETHNAFFDARVKRWRSIDTGKYINKPTMKELNDVANSKQ